MWYLYLDESGDLGFDFINKKPSKFFTVTILAIRGQNNKQLLKAVCKVPIFSDTDYTSISDLS